MRVSKIYYIGFEAGVKDNALDILGEPPKPGNYKQETYEAKLPELRAKRLSTAHNDLRAGDIKAMALISPEDPAAHMVTFDELRALVKGADAYIVGFSPKFRLQQAAWARPEHAPSWVWFEGHEGVEFIDLYRLSGAKNDGMKLDEMLSFWLPSWIPEGNTAQDQAYAAQTIAQSMGVQQSTGVLHFA
jgi:hypothetical protein